MVSRKPLVLVNGEMTQLDPTDTLDALVIEVDVSNLVNKESTTMVIGMPVYSSGADQVKKAQANASGTKNVIGLVKTTSIIADASGAVQTSGVITATTVQWDAVIEAGSGGLIFNTKYYLSPTTAGKITATAPSTTGQFLCPIGIAISTTELSISRESVISL
jgi:hypothetical protein